MIRGNVIVGQSGGPTAAINASLAGVIAKAYKSGVNKVYGMRYGIEGLLKDNVCLINDVIKDEHDINLLRGTPSAFLGSCRKKLPEISENEETYKEIFGILEKYEIGAFLYIGGNDSMDTIKKLSAYAGRISSDIRFIGVPKTIDNDLAVTDHTPGYGSAAKFIATTVKELVRDSLVYDMDSVTIVEIMGRNAGWLTGAAALARAEDCEGADLLYLPETVFDIDEFVYTVKKLMEKKRSIVICVSEGIKTADGKYVFEGSMADVKVDVFGHKMMSGTAKFLADILSGRLGCKTRAVELNTLQRCASHIVSATDINESFSAGEAGVLAAENGESGKMVIFTRSNAAGKYEISTGLYDINAIANVEKKVPLEWIDTANHTVRQEFVDYARPLIEGEIVHETDGGIVKHIILN